ncbi:MAG: hypothetical protein PVH05_05570 [Burkholderiales bacterium]
MIGRFRLSLLALILALGVLPAMQAGAEQMQTQVIELYARGANDMVRLLRPMLVPGGRISGLGDKLVITTTPRNMAQLRAMLAEVDVPPRQLLVTVRQDVSGQRLEQNVEMTGGVGNDRVRIGSPPGTDTDGVDIRIDSARREDTGGKVQTLRVIEGEAAFISTGESVPYRVQSPNGGGRPVEYHDVVSGLFAIVRLRGGGVNVQLANRSDAVIDRTTGATHIQRISSVVSGRVGEWIEIGGTGQSITQSESGTVYHRSEASSERSRIYIKVEELN